MTQLHGHDVYQVISIFYRLEGGVGIEGDLGGINIILADVLL